MLSTCCWLTRKHAGRRLPRVPMPRIKKGRRSMPTPSVRKEQILATYARHGGQMTVRRLAQYCWEEGVWGIDDQRRMAFAAAKRECHAALQTKTSAGLPVAGPTAGMEGN